MPELIEVEFYRLDLDVCVGSAVEEVTINDTRALRPKGVPSEAFDALVGQTLVRTWRRGKLLLAEFGVREQDRGCSGHVLAIRFGMTGRLLVNGDSRISQLEYASSRNDPSWDRVEIEIGEHLVTLRDQRCLGSVELNPDLSFLAPEASQISHEELVAALRGRTKAIKAVLLDQSLIAGLGNLLADEVLWSCGIAPQRPANELTDGDVERLTVTIREVVRSLTAAGGSNCGESFPARTAGASCPRCGGSMRRDSVGGRSSWWCTAHQA